MPIKRAYRIKLGYTNGELLKKHFSGTDILEINWNKIELYNSRIKEIFHELNAIVHESIKYEDLSSFDSKIDNAYKLMKNNDLIPKLNNNGRAREEVYYNWMRGYAICEFFFKALSIVFNVSQSSIKRIGKDNLTNIEKWSKSSTADLEIKLKNKIIRLEIQSGFKGKNDIKEQKVLEAKKLSSKDISSYIVHFDLYNGNAAIVNISEISDSNINWEHRQQFENKKVFSIPSEAFNWILTDAPPNYTEISIH